MENKKNNIKRGIVYQFTFEGNKYYVYNTIDIYKGSITKY